MVIISRKIGKGEPHELILAKPNKTLLEHAYETGWVCETLLKASAFAADVKRISKLSGMNDNAVINSISYLAASHDIGKAFWRWQCQQGIGNDGLVTMLVEHGLINEEMTKAQRQKPCKRRHEEYSKKILEPYVGKRCAEIISRHHQNKDKAKYYPAIDEEAYIKRWEEQIIGGLREAINKEFQWEDMKFDGHEGIIYTTILGLIIISDWIASGNTFEDIHKDDFQGLEDYKQEVITRCNALIDACAFAPLNLKESYSWEELFPDLSGFEPQPLQKKAMEVIARHPNMQLMLVEGETGSGKTEIAQYVMANILCKAEKTGIYLAEPTGAIAESMLGRVSEFAKAIDYNGNVRLLHSKAWMGEVGRADTEDDGDKQRMSTPGIMKIFNTLACGTVDQMMAAAQALRYGQIRVAALMSKGIIFDEIHSYDAYMETLNENLYDMLNKSGSPVVMLSATLTDMAKRKIFKSFGCEEEKFSPGYPLISVIDNGKLYEYPSEPSGNGRKITPELRRFDFDRMEGIADITDEVMRDGGCVSIIANRVKHANAIMKILRKKYKDDDEMVLLLLHARMPQSEKDRLTRTIIELFGKKGKKEGKRPKKAIVVSTQIVEQSMDVDFDSMITFLAPIDSIVQRDGRRRRHDDAGTIRENKDYHSRLIVLYPDKTDKYNALPYNEDLLRETLRYLQKKKSIKVPEELRGSMNAVYENAKTALDSSSAYAEQLADSKKMILDDEDFWYNPLWEKDSVPETRHITRRMTDLAILPDMAEPENWTRTKCIEFIHHNAVSVPEDELNGIVFMETDNYPGYLHGIRMLRKSDADRYNIRLDPVYGMLIG